MIKKKLNKIIGIKKIDFDSYVKSWEIQLQYAKLIPLLKTGDEMALTSIFLTTLKLVKEYRDSFFRDIKFPKWWKTFYYTEICIPSLGKSRIDGLIINVSKWKIVQAAFFEMKNKRNTLDSTQIKQYIDISKKLWISRLITISNQFVPNPTHSPINIRVPKAINLLHFSWTDLRTKWHLLLFKNSDVIQDADQMEVMREVLHYMGNTLSGISGYTQMDTNWKQLVENVQAKKALKKTDETISKSILSWYEEEKDIALLMSRRLWVLVKSSSKTEKSLQQDIQTFIKKNHIKWLLNVKNSVSDIKIFLEFERKAALMSVRVRPPQDRWTTAQINWLIRQLNSCKEKANPIYCSIENQLWVEVNVKYAQANIKIKASELDTLVEITKWKEINDFYVVYVWEFWRSFASNKKFVELIEKMTLEFYEAIVQYMTNWNAPTPKLEALK